MKLLALPMCLASPFGQEVFKCVAENGLTVRYPRHVGACPSARGGSQAGPSTKLGASAGSHGPPGGEPAQHFKSRDNPPAANFDFTRLFIWVTPIMPARRLPRAFDCVPALSRSSVQRPKQCFHNQRRAISKLTRVPPPKSSALDMPRSPPATSIFMPLFTGKTRSELPNASPYPSRTFQSWRESHQCSGEKIAAVCTVQHSARTRDEARRIALFYIARLPDKGMPPDL
jgi:hypothetical protein